MDVPAPLGRNDEGVSETLIYDSETDDHGHKSPIVPVHRAPSGLDSAGPSTAYRRAEHPSAKPQED